MKTALLVFAIVAVWLGVVAAVNAADDYPVGRSPWQIRERQRQSIAINNNYRYVEEHHIKPRPPLKAVLPPEYHEKSPGKIRFTARGFEPAHVSVSGFAWKEKITWVWPNDGKPHRIVCRGFFDSGEHKYPHEFTYECSPPEFDGMGGTPYGASGARLTYRDECSGWSGVVVVSQIR